MENFEIEQPQPQLATHFLANKLITKPKLFNSWLFVYLVFFKSMIGLGSLEIPFAFLNVGFVLGATGMLYVGIVTWYGMNMVCRLASQLNYDEDKIEGLGKLCWGKFGYYLTLIANTSMNFSILVANLIYISEYLKTMTCKYWLLSICSNEIYFFFMAALILFAMILVVHAPKYLAGPAFIAASTICIATISLSIYFFPIFVENLITRPGAWRINYQGFPKFFGLTSYALEGIGSIFVIRHSAPDQNKFSKMVLNVMILATAILCVYGGVSEGALQEKTPKLIFQAFTSSQPFFYLIGIIYGFALLLTIPVFIFPITASLEDFKSIKHFVYVNKKKKLSRQLFVRFAIIFLVLILAIIGGDIIFVICFSGSLFSPLISFLIPILFNWKLNYENLSSYQFTVEIFIFVSGIIFGIFGIYSSLNQSHTIFCKNQKKRCNYECNKKKVNLPSNQTSKKLNKLNTISFWGRYIPCVHEILHKTKAAFTISNELIITLHYLTQNFYFVVAFTMNNSNSFYFRLNQNTEFIIIILLQFNYQQKVLIQNRSYFFCSI